MKQELLIRQIGRRLETPGMKTPALLSASIILAVSITAHAQLLPVLGSQRVGITTAEFLKIGVGARANAMAESFTAVANDVFALYYNPAGITEFDKTQLAFSHSTWFVGLQHDFIGGVYHLNRQNSIGVSVISLRSDDMPVTTEYQPYGTGEYFRYGDVALGITFARKMTERFSFGVSVKYVDETLADVSLRGVLVDLGTYYRTGIGSTRFAVSVSNFGGQMAPSGTAQLVDGTSVSSFQGFSPPTIFRIGFAFEPYEDRSNRITASAQLNHPADNSENLAVGAEYSYVSMFYVRGGYKINVTEQTYSAGAGIKASTSFALVSFDYSFTPYQRLGDVHRFSIDLSF